MAIICVTVLILPQILAGMTMPAAAAGSPVDLDLLAEQLHRGDPGARAALEQQAAALQTALGAAATEQLRRQVAAFDFAAALQTLRLARGHQPLPP